MPNPKHHLAELNGHMGGNFLAEKSLMASLREKGYVTAVFGMVGRRSDTAHFMAAIGPSFKSAFANEAPVSNADIAPTLAHLLGIELPPSGPLKGRVMTEILKDGPDVVSTRKDIVSDPSPEGLRTIVNLQYVRAASGNLDIHHEQACRRT